MKRLFSAILFSSLVACGGDSDSPADQCRDLVSDMCTRAIECIAPGDDHGECVDAVAGQFMCDKVGKVSDTFDDCLDDLNSATCDVLFQPDPETSEPQLVPPQSCFNVLLPE